MSLIGLKILELKRSAHDYCEKSAAAVSTLIPEQWKKEIFASKSQGDTYVLKYIDEF